MTPNPWDRKPTKRELQVVALIADGATYSDVGAALDISAMTARTHGANVLRHLGVHSMAHAVAVCIRRGWIE